MEELLRPMFKEVCSWGLCHTAAHVLISLFKSSHSTCFVFVGLQLMISLSMNLWVYLFAFLILNFQTSWLSLVWSGGAVLTWSLLAVEEQQIVRTAGRVQVSSGCRRLITTTDSTHQCCPAWGPGPTWGAAGWLTGRGNHRNQTSHVWKTASNHSLLNTEVICQICVAAPERTIYLTLSWFFF